MREIRCRVVGDALGFLAQLYSSEVLLALKSGGSAADAIAAGDTRAAWPGSWEPEFVAGVERRRRMVCEFYDGLNFGQFVRRHADRKGLVTDILIGDLFRPEDSGPCWTTSGQDSRPRHGADRPGTLPPTAFPGPAAGDLTGAQPAGPNRGMGRPPADCSTPDPRADSIME